MKAMRTGRPAGDRPGPRNDARWHRHRLAGVAGLLATTLASSSTLANPALEGTRNLAMGPGARASASGASAALINPSAMSMSQMFAVDAAYQLNVRQQTHGIGTTVMDSLNNPRVALGLGYIFMRGNPTIRFDDGGAELRRLELIRMGHEVFLGVSVAILKQWLAVAIKPKFQNTGLQYKDMDGKKRHANKLNAFGFEAGVTANLGGWLALAIVGYNLAGWQKPAYTEDEPIDLPDIGAVSDTFSYGGLPRVSDYPLMLGHAVAVFPLRTPDFSLNFDGLYDFSSYRFGQRFNHTRLIYGGSAEFLAGPVPLRAGGYWDGRGPDDGDDVAYVTAGIGYAKAAPLGGVGLDAGFGLRQQVMGPSKETIIGFNLAIRLHPDL